MSVGQWTCLERECGVVNDGPTLDDIMYNLPTKCKGCGAKATPDLQDLIPFIKDLYERVEALEARVPPRSPFEGLGL